MKETELAQHFVKYLSCFDLYFEVAYFNTVDIVAITERYSIAVEVKTTFNFKVLEQAIRNKPHFNYSYIACPFSRDMYFQKQLCENYGIGLLIYNENIYMGSLVSESVAPQLNRHASLKHLKEKLHDRYKTNTPGSQTGASGVVTAFQETVESATQFVKRTRGGCTMTELIKGISHHYGTQSTAKACLYNYIKQGVIKDLEIRNNKIHLKVN